jgi:hypothetical protein
LGRGWAIQSLGVCGFFGSGANQFQDEAGFGDAAPLGLFELFVEQQPAFSDPTVQHSNNRVQQRRNEAANAYTA